MSEKTNILTNKKPKKADGNDKQSVGHAKTLFTTFFCLKCVENDC